MKTKSLKLALIVAIALFAVSVLALFAPIALAADAQTVTLTSDMEQAYVVDGGKNVTIDLAGFTMKAGVTATGAGTVVTITDSSDAQTGAINGMYAVSALDGGKVVIQKANVDATMYAIYANDGTVEMNGGVATSQMGYGVVLFGSDSVGAAFTLNGGAINGSVGLTATGDDQFDNCNVAINGGTITAANDQIAVYWASTGLLKVTGGTVTGATAVYVKSGSVDITGGTFVATGAAYQYKYTETGAVATGDALVVENANQDVYQAITSASVANATFTSQNAKAIASYAPVASNKVVSFLAEGVVANTAVEAALLGEGYEVSVQNGTYTVVEGSAVKVGDKNYGTFQRGFDAALATGEKLVLLQNVDLADQTLVIPASKAFAIDLNGFVLSGASNQRNHKLIVNNGTFVVEDNSTAASGEILYTFTGTGDASFGTGNYTVVNCGHMTVNSGTINNATAAMTHMRDAIDNNSTVRDAVLVINGGTVKCDTYMAIRQFANSTKFVNDVVINGGSVGKIFVQGSNANAQKASLQVKGGEVVGLFVSFELNSQNLALDVDTSCITSDYMHFYLDSTHKVHTDANGKLSMLQGTQVAQVGTNYYTFEDAIAKANETGEKVVLIADATMDKATNVTANVTIDLNGKTLKLNVATLYFLDCQATITNGTLDLSGVVAKGDCIVGVGNYSKSATLTLDKVNVVGDGYSSAYAVFYVYDGGSLFVNNSTVNLANDNASAGGAFKSETVDTTTIKFTNSQVSLKDAKIGFLNGNVAFEESKLTIEGGKNAINGSILTIVDSEVEIFGSPERGITVTNGPVTIVNSTVNVHDMAEADVRFKSNDEIVVQGNSTFTASSVVVDKYQQASLKDLIVADATATVPTFEVVVDGVAYKTVAEGLAKVKANSYVELLADYTTDVTTVITANFTLVGNGYTFASTARKTFEIKNATNTDINVKFDNVNIVNAYQIIYDGRCIDTRNDHINLTVTNCTLTTTNANAGSQPLTIGGSEQEGVNVTLTGTTIVAGGTPNGYYGYAIVTFVKTNFTIDNCDITGYATLYFNPSNSSNSTATITNSKLNAINEYEDNVANNFGAIAVHATNVEVQISGTQVTITEGLQNCIYKLVAFDSTASSSANNKVTLANDVTVNGQPSQNQVLAGFEVKTQTGTTYYTSFQQALENAVDGDQINFGRDVVLDADVVISKNVTVNFNGFEMVLTGTALKITAEVTFTNGTIDITGAVAKQIHLVYVGVISTPGTLTLDNVDVVGDGYQMDYSVFFMGNKGTLNIVNGSIVTLANDAGSRGGVFKADGGTSEATLNITDSTVSLKDAKIGFLNAVVTLTDSKLTIEGGRNAINGSVLTIVRSEVEIFGSNERGITLDRGDVVIVDSTVDIHDMAEASIRFKKDFALQVKGTSTLTAETIVIDAATGATFQDLVTVEPTATMSDFVISVDEMSYTNAMQALAAVKANSVITLFPGYDFTLPTALTFNCDVTVNGNGNVVYTTNSQTVVVDGAKVTFNNVTIQNAGTAFYVKANSSVVVNACQIDTAFLVAFDGTGSTLVVDGQTVSTANDEVAVKAQVEGKTVYASDLATLVAYLGDTYTQVEITLYADQILTETQIVVASGATWTINLNGNDITGTNTTAGKFLVENHGNLTINGEGTIAYSYVGAQDASYGRGNGTISNCGTLAVNNATLRNDTAAMSHSLNVIDNNSTLANVTAILTNTKVLLANNGIAIRQFANSSVNENNVVLNGTTEVSGKAAMQVMLPSSDTATRKASVTINDSVVVKSTNAGGFAFYTYSAGNSLADVTINVTGGQFYGYFAVGYSAKPVAVTETLNVTGGTFVDYMIYCYADTSAITTNNYNVTGGSYAYAPSQVVVAQGHVIAANKDNTYSVVTDLAYVEDYVSEDAKAELKAYMEGMIANGFYSQVGVANLNAMWQNACTKLDQATTIEQTQVIVNETKQEFTYVVNKWEEAALQAQALVTLKQYAAANGVAEALIPAAAIDAINASATEYNVNVALMAAMKAVDQVVADQLAQEFALAVAQAVEEVTLYAQTVGVNVDTTAVAAATNYSELATAVAAAKAAVDTAFDVYQQTAVEALYGTNNQNEAHVTTAMVASIYAAQTKAEVDVALQVAAAEIAQIAEYKNKINETYASVQTAIDAANNAATKATEAAAQAIEAANKALAAGVSADAAKAAADAATASAILASNTAQEAKAAAEAAKAAAESGKATAQELATVVANAQAAAEAAKAAAEAAAEAANKAADKAQSTEVKVYAETATAELQVWLNNFLETLAATTPVAADNTTVASYRAQLQAQIKDLYSEENQALVLSYYDQTMSAINLATSEAEVDYAIKTFKTNIALVDVLENMGNDAPVQEGGNYKTWLLALAAVEALLAVAVLCLLFKKKTIVTVELPIEEEPAQEQPAPVVEQVAEEPAEEVVEEAVEEEAVEEEVVEEEVVEEEVVEEAAEEDEEDEADDDQDEVEVVVVADGEADPFANLQNRTSKTFDERLAEADDETRAIYQQIQSYLLCYKKVKERRSKKCASFRKGRQLLVKVLLRGKSFNVFLALNPDDYAESVYHHKNKGDKKAYEQVPMMVRVRSPRSLKKLQRLIDEMLAGEEKIEYVIPVEPVVEETAPVVEEVVETPAPVLDDGEDQEVYDDEEDDDDDDGEEEVATEQPAAEGEVDPFANLQNRKSKTFDERLAEAEEEIRATYEQIRASFLCYKKVKERKSKKFVSFRSGRNLLAKVSLRGKSFNVFLALNPDDYAESVYHHKNKGDKKAYEQVSMMVRVRSPRSLKKLQRLIEEMFPGEEKIEYVIPTEPVVEETAPVVEEVVEVAPVEVVEPVVELAEEEAPADPFADLQNRKSKTFDERLAEAEEETRAIYEEIKAAFLAHKKVKERQSKKFVSFRKGRNLLAKVVLRGKSFNVFLALNPEEYAETVYHHKAKGDKKAYELVPMMVRVRSPRSVKKVKRLIDDVVAKANAPQA